MMVRGSLAEGVRTASIVPVERLPHTPPHRGWGKVQNMDSYQRSVVNRLKTARGQVGGIISLVEADAYCPDVMKQLSAVQGLLEGASRVMLRRHLETCVAKAMQEGRTAEIVDELMETLKFDKHVFRPPVATERDDEHDPATPADVSADV
jgi:DNA-binding FrmR family transcriptional regulator